MENSWNVFINLEINLILNWPKDGVISSALKKKFAIRDTKPYVPVVTLSTQDKIWFKRTIKWNKYQSKVSTEKQNQYLDFLIDPSFQGVNTLCFIVWK